MITWDDVTDIATSLASVPIQTQQAILAQVELELDEVAWGAGIDLGRKYLAMHLGTLYLRNVGGDGAVGPVTSESVGDVSRSYAAPSMTDDAFSATGYGKEFVRLRDSFVVPRIGMVI